MVRCLCCYGGAEPLLTVLGKVVVGEKWHSQWNIGLWWGEVAVEKGFVDDVEGSAATRFLEVGGHTPNRINFQVSVSAAA